MGLPIHPMMHVRLVASSYISVHAAGPRASPRNSLCHVPVGTPDPGPFITGP